jgi:type IV secretory pathway VirB10-like protein
MCIFSAPSMPATPPPPPPPPVREDPEVAAASNKQRLAEKRRKGRAATMIAEKEGELGVALLDRPGASAADQLGSA